MLNLKTLNIKKKKSIFKNVGDPPPFNLSLEEGGGRRGGLVAPYRFPLEFIQVRGYERKRPVGAIQIDDISFIVAQSDAHARDINRSEIDAFILQERTAEFNVFISKRESANFERNDCQNVGSRWTGAAIIGGIFPIFQNLICGIKLRLSQSGGRVGNINRKRRIISGIGSKAGKNNVTVDVRRRIQSCVGVVNVDESLIQVILIKVINNNQKISRSDV